MKKSTPAACPMPRKDCPNVLPLEGEIDLHISPNVTASLSMMIEKKPKQLIVDLSRVTYIDSSGLAALIEGMQNTEEYGGKFALAGLQETIRTIFEIARLDQVFQIFPDVDTALAAAPESKPSKSA
ncbi:MAG: anti-anti-sigma factor [Verrucomicrobia bacterium]|nr:MAG: anti-anti-sigma factor [Verrucomicrobiota bacterium]